MCATVRCGEFQVCTGYLIVGILKQRGLIHELSAIWKEFDKIKLETLTDRFAEVVAGSPEEALSARDGFQVGGAPAPREASGPMAPAQMGKQEALRPVSVGLTQRAPQGELDPILGPDQ